ncbi:hypothetical protein [Neorhodopirellula lusitana]|uniref:hypothetical protein n=1 Tax=Neorhodopirellula lusitana TaxID=445327 RepID=UPI003850D97B
MRSLMPPCQLGLVIAPLADNSVVSPCPLNDPMNGRVLLGSEDKCFEPKDFQPKFV